MKFIFRHPIWSGFGIEMLLVFLFWLFPAGAGNSPVVGVAVVYAHYPALLFVERVLGIQYSARQAFLSAFLMMLFWIGALLLLRRLPILRRFNNPNV